MNPEIYTYVMERAFDKGALDFFMTPIIMKKNRPGITLSVLCQETDIRGIEEILFLETTTLGLRKYPVERSILDRKLMQIETKYGDITVKLGFFGGKIMKFSP